MDRPPIPHTAAVTLTGAAGVLHLVAAGAHLGSSVLIVAGFVGVGLVQVALLATARSRPAATLDALVFVDLAALGAWAVSRTVGLPVAVGGSGVETVGVGDLTVVALQVVALGSVLLSAALSTRVANATGSLAVAASLGAVAFAAPAAAVHDHDHPVATVEVTVASSPARPLGFLGPSDQVGVNPLATAASAARMRAAMTGQVERTTDTAPLPAHHTATPEAHGEATTPEAHVDDGHGHGH